MSYEAAIESLYALGHELAPDANPDPARVPPSPAGPRSRKWDLAHMRTLCAALGDPQLRFRSILIAGTNGKGSTAATLASILAASGARAALYTSPHLVRVNERIQLGGAGTAEYGAFELEPISDDDFARLYFRVDDTANLLVRQSKLPHPPSFFEVLTAVAFLHFAESKAEIAVLEVGLGGRLDATNIVEPMVSILTDISLDHTEWLGDTIAEIAREKAGILRANGVLITLPQHPEANQAIGEAATALHVRAINAVEYMPFLHTTSSDEPSFAQPDAKGLSLRNRYPLSVLGEEIEVDSPLSGAHQRRNIALAVAAAVEVCHHHSGILNICNSWSGILDPIRHRDGCNITAASIREGIRRTRWPGRLELLRLPSGASALLDVAHNPAGAWALRSALSNLPQEAPRTLLFGCLRDKAVAEIAQIIVPLFDRAGDSVLVAPVDNPRSASADELFAAVEPLGPVGATHALPDARAALARALLQTPQGGMIVITGSVYLVGQVRALLLPATSAGEHSI